MSAQKSFFFTVKIELVTKKLFKLMGAQKSYLSCGLKLELVTTYHLRFIVKLL